DGVDLAVADPAQDDAVAHGAHAEVGGGESVRVLLGVLHVDPGVGAVHGVVAGHAVPPRSVLSVDLVGDAGEERRRCGRVAGGHHQSVGVVGPWPTRVLAP